MDNVLLCTDVKLEERKEEDEVSSSARRLVFRDSFSFKISLISPKDFFYMIYAFILTDRDVYLNDSGDIEVVPGPNRETKIRTALKKRQDNKVECEKALQSLKALVEEKHLPGENPYKYVIQELLHGEASSIDKKIREEVYNYIKKRYLGLQGVFYHLLKEEDLDNEIASIIVEAIKEVTDGLEVELKELTCIATLATSIVEETVKEFQLAKGKFVRECILCWTCHNLRYFESKKKAKLWVDNPVATFSTIDPDKNGKPGYCVHGKTFIIPGLDMASFFLRG